MSKIFKNIVRFSLVTFSTLLLISCNDRNHHRNIKGNGNIVTEKRTVYEGFESVSVSNAIEVEIIQDDQTEILVETDDNIQNSILTKIENGTLIISRKKGSYTSSKPQKITVKMPIITELTASSASSIKTRDTLKGENIYLNCSSAAKIEALLAYDHIKVNSSSASKIELKGIALDFNAEASSASKIDAEDLLTNDVIAKSSSAAKIAVHPIVSLKAKATSGSKIEYNNTPKSIEKETNSGGNIELE
jgi:hypothetical protein